MESDITVVMKVLAGTSGFSYKEWVGAFYPEKTAAKAMLAYYATRLPVVEINNTFYRMPNADAIGAWRAQVPESFRFAVKAPRRITHVKRLKDCQRELDFLLPALQALEPCLGSILFQLPPFAKVDVATLSSFVDLLPRGCRAAFEFRNPTWLAPEVYAVLSARNLALVHSEVDEPLAGDLRGPRTGHTCACEESSTPRPISPRGSLACGRRRCPKPTSSSSTKIKPRGRSSPSASSASPRASPGRGSARGTARSAEAPPARHPPVDRASPD